MPAQRFRPRGTRRMLRRLLTGAAATAMVCGSLPPDASAAHQPDAGVEVFAHRGASGYRPEHTLAAYDLAARMGADDIEPDLVSTKDGVLVDRHEPEIGSTTDVAQHPEFQNRRTTKVIDGERVTGWFVEDFTLAELKTLRAKERIPKLRPHNTVYDGRFPIPTFAEVLAERAKLSRELHRPIGIIPEVKHSTYFRKLRLPIEPKLVDQLRASGLDHPGAPVVVQSFEVGNLKQLRQELPYARLLQLVQADGAPEDLRESGDPRTYRDLLTPDGMREIARYADAVGPELTQVLPQDASGALTTPSALVPHAHAAGLQVIPYTVRAENAFLPTDFRRGSDPSGYGDVFAYFRRLFDQHLDGIFSDNPDMAVRARDEYRHRT